MYQDSLHVLERGTEAFPGNYALKVFLAMTLYNLRENSHAMEILLQALAETSSDARVQRYKRAISFYADKLDETWGF
jgi:predicted Zn-dependent protease